MAFRVCCSCKTPLGPSEGFVSRLCRVTQTLGTVIGTESYFWTLASGYSDKWSMSFTAPSTGEFLLEGFRVEWYGPTENGQQFNGMYPIGDSNSISTLYEYIRERYLNSAYCVGSERKYDSGNRSGAQFRQFSINHLPYTNLLSTKVPIGGHVSNESLRGISFGVYSAGGLAIPPIRVSDASYITVPTEVRIKYWRLLANGEPISEIMPGYHPASRTTQTMLPFEDVSTTTWSASTGTDFYALINEPIASTNPSTYIWSGEDGSDGITFKLTDFTYTGGYNYLDVKTRATIVNASGTPVSSASKTVRMVLKYEGQDVAYTVGSVSGNGSDFTSINFRFADLANRSVPIRESCSFIPIDADPTKFRLTITVTNATSTQRLAIATLNVVSEPFSYFLGTGFATNTQAWWPIEAAYRIPWRKNVLLGFDIWLEAVRSSGVGFQATLGRFNQSAGKYEGLTADSAHGTLAIRTTFMPEYNPTEFTYYVKFLNGTWRPTQLDLGSTDTKTFNISSSGNSFLTGGDERTGYFALVGSNPEDGKPLQVSLRFNQEVPEVFISGTSISTSFLVNGVPRDSLKYVPEDTGHAITNFWFYHGSTLGNVYVNSQTPGGVWKHKRVTKFVLERPVQTSTTNSFSPEELIDLSDFPTEIEVGPAYPPQTYSFYETTDWECPSNVSSVTVRCWGAGGGGGATDDYSGSAAGGGGGGAFSSKIVSVTPGTIYTITVGAGGAGGVDGNINGQAGGDSWFVDAATVMAKGGSGGTGATLDDDEAGGAGGAAASGVGTTKFSGGKGADGLSGNYGGGGGASAGTNNNGTAATTATGATGTNNGGNGGTGSTATAGGLPGGGGGGNQGTAASDTIRPGGAGAGGLVTLRY